MAKAIPLSELPVFSARRPPDPNFHFQGGAAFLVDKPAGWSSFEVVKLLRRCLDMRKIGHAGTLDPMATGLLVLCCGRGTKSIQQIQVLEKVYVGEVTFGAATASYDAETEVTEEAPWQHLTGERIADKMEEAFTGDIIQYPPMYSAVKHKGQPLYKLARQGKEVERKPRVVTVHELRLLECRLPVIKLYIRCGKGTYVRSIAHDLGRALDQRPVSAVWCANASGSSPTKTPSRWRSSATSST
ncbi:MAG: tRNA pseudouridine(55) synthase TruB [Balneolaceae bacterium]|nr:tRNA pseudouridine(55) synthase TruB [Balneolaceae bacterium]